MATPFATEQPGFMQAWGEYYYFFAPVIVETTDGTLISVAEARDSPATTRRWKGSPKRPAPTAGRPGRR